MLYWIKETDGQSIYSVDMLRFEFVVTEKHMDIITKEFASSNRQDIESYGLSTSPFKYRYLYKINYKMSSMAIGLGFNGITKLDNMKCFIELNPNKVFQDNKAIDDMYFIIENSAKFRLKRWDLAIDVPIQRNLIQLVKDQRKYALTMKSNDDKTEYLGSRNKGGFIKLYNKTIESKLAYDCTRLEITCDNTMAIDEIMSSIPKMQVSRYQLDITTDSNLSDKDRLLVDLLKMHPDYFKRLDKRNRRKFERYVFGDNESLEFNRHCVARLLKRVYSYEK